MTNTIYLIGGAPGAGKTTLGSALAGKLGIRSITVDDLVTAAIAVTSIETHPKLHALRRVPHIEYFTNSTPAELQADANHRHEATIPIMQSVIRKYVSQGLGLVLDGWHIRPDWVRTLEYDNLWASWIVIDEAVLIEREKQLTDYYGASPDPDKMFDNFMSRSLWYNNLMQQEASKYNLPILHQNGEQSVDTLCQMILQKSGSN